MMDIFLNLVPSLIVGFGGAWLASQRALVEHAEKLRATETKLNALDRRFTEFHADASASALIHIERLTRIETKVDIALQRRE